MIHKWYRWYRITYVGAGNPDRESIMFVRAYDLDHARRVFADTIDRYALIDDEDPNGAILNVQEGSIWPRTRRMIQESKSQGVRKDSILDGSSVAVGLMSTQFVK